MSLSLVDTHCHLDSPRFGSSLERSGVLERAAEAGVEALIVPGVYPSEWRSLLELVGVPAPVKLWACLGIHPQVLPELDDAAISSAFDGLGETPPPGVVAVGECGLDGPTAALAGGELERQLEVLEQHASLAERWRVPLVLHCYRLHEPMLKYLERRGGFSYGIVLHSYSGSAELVRRYLALNAYFSMAGSVTWANARRPQLAARAIPLERLLLETDSPDQTPEPHRLHMNEPAYLCHIAEAVARCRSTGVENIALETTKNALRCFGLSL